MSDLVKSIYDLPAEIAKYYALWDLLAGILVYATGVLSPARGITTSLSLLFLFATVRLLLSLIPISGIDRSAVVSELVIFYFLIGLATLLSMQENVAAKCIGLILEFGMLGKLIADAAPAWKAIKAHMGI